MTEEDFRRALRAPQSEATLGGPIRKAAFDEPMEYFASDRKPDPTFTLDDLLKIQRLKSRQLVEVERGEVRACKILFQ